MKKTHWLDKWQNEKEMCDELLFYEKELHKAINEVIEYEKQLKSLYYRIEMLREKISFLNGE